LTYRAKKESETWNWYLIHLFREGGGVNFCHFCDKYFNEERTLKYREGLAKEKEDKELKESKKRVSKEQENSTEKTSFAKKPERLKKKKGYLF